MERKFIVIRCVVVGANEPLRGFPTKGAHHEIPQRHEEHEENRSPRDRD